MVDVVTDDRHGNRPRSRPVVRRLPARGEGYALEVMRVQEVLDMQSLTEVPGGPKFLLGVINLRGHVVPVYDLRMPFGLPKDPKPTRAPCVLIVESTLGSDIQITGLLGGPGLRRPGVLSRRSASRLRSLDLGKRPPSSAA